MSCRLTLIPLYVPSVCAPDVMLTVLLALLLSGQLLLPALAVGRCGMLASSSIVLDLVRFVDGYAGRCPAGTHPRFNQRTQVMRKAPAPA